jgi:polygalacturonase
MKTTCHTPFQAAKFVLSLLPPELVKLRWLRIKRYAALILAALLLLPRFAPAAEMNVKSYGAVGDGVALDTPALQRAIDACAAGGGGRVVFPAGRYLTGSLRLASGVTLVVTPQATIIGSTAMRDYPLGRLLAATGAANVGIEGGGVIDGQGEAFWEKSGDYKGPPWRGTAQFEYRALKRPSFIHFTGCTNVHVRDITLSNSPSWTLHLQRCVTANVERVTIRNPLYGPNTDGIDLNSCQNVRIRQCDIITGDDGVVLKSSEPGRGHPSRYIRVENCRIWSACNALKIGTETHDDFDDIQFRDCHLYCDSERMLDRPLAGIAIESVDGSHLSNIVVSNITMSNVRTPIFVRLGHRGGNSPRTRQVEPRVPGTIDGVVFRNITAEHAGFESSITGIPGHPVRNVTLSDIRLTYEGGGEADWVTDDVPDKTVIAKYPESQMFGRLPAYGLYVRHADGLRVSNAVLRCESEDARPAVVCDDVNAVEFDALSIAAAPARFPVLWFINTSRAAVRRSAAPEGTKTFLAVEPETMGDVVMEATDLTKAAVPLARLKRGELLAADLPVFGEQPAGVLVIPAGKMRLSRPMSVVTDAALASASAIEVPFAGGREAGSARCRFTVAEAGDYVIWTHALAPSGESDSFYVAIDGGEPALSDLSKLGAWNWDRVRERSGDKPSKQAFKTFPLAAGEHTLTLRNRECGTRIGMLVIVKKDRSFDPTREQNEN